MKTAARLMESLLPSWWGNKKTPFLSVHPFRVFENVASRTSTSILNDSSSSSSRTAPTVPANTNQQFPSQYRLEGENVTTCGSAVAEVDDAIEPTPMRTASNRYKMIIRMKTSHSLDVVEMRSWNARLYDSHRIRTYASALTTRKRRTSKIVTVVASTAAGFEPARA